VLDDHAGGGAAGVELGHAFVGRVGVVDVVVGELLALHLPSGRDAKAPLGAPIERRRLMRVLAVAQRLREPSAEGTIRGRRIVQLPGEPVRDRGVIGCGARIGLRGEPATEAEGGAARPQRVEQRRVILRVHDDRDIVVVLGRSTDHGGPADVDILDAILEACTLRDGGLERVEVHHQKIDRLDAVRRHRARVFGIGADRQQTAMHLGMQRLDTAVHHLGKAGELRDVDHSDPRIGDRLGGAAGRNDLDACGGQRARKINQAGLVGNGNQRAFDAARGGGHGWLRSPSPGGGGSPAEA
jgi:hypothetical protein